ncbi:hypothetical protein V8C37DRAFT_393737 [Trichoderma ceciliae]
MLVIMLNAVPSSVLASVLASAVPTNAATDVIGLSKKLKLHGEECMASGSFTQSPEVWWGSLYTHGDLTRMTVDSRFSHYFGEIALWTGLATATADMHLQAFTAFLLLKGFWHTLL